MIRNDTLTCELIPNAIKNDELTCSVPPLDHLQLWSTIGDVLTALVTFLLAAFALLAWLTSRRTLRQMERDSSAQVREIERQVVEQRRLMEEQVASQDRLAREDRAINALARYMTSLRDGQTDFDKYSPNVLKAISEIAVSWTLWANQIRHVSAETFNHAQTWHAGSLAYFARLSTLANQIGRREGAREEYQELVLELSKFTTNWLELVAAWQLSVNSRAETLRKMKGEASAIVAAAPKPNEPRKEAVTTNG
ncbi:hypothetical protein I6N91_03170 [Arthrobacter sp. MSA 4-2]|uniref:hypothetical protein n=1 Tax=Arthrobacter sp. MSA 4-2 TaxID=2794349 RepID=UPI0018E767E0|nr:hypothetical protein [Arthrobacter sp. MSA 4-2]MBJ2119975.1 hypothetical protein [Arthrobacter sp. MSA 4-2]